MNKRLLNVTVTDSKYVYEEGTSYGQIVSEIWGDTDKDIILVKVDGILQELFKPLRDDCSLEPVYTSDHIGSEAYRRSLVFLMVRACYELLGPDVHVRVNFSLGRGMYCTLSGRKADADTIAAIKSCMQELVDRDVAVNKYSRKTRHAKELFGEFGQTDKEKLFKYRLSSYTNIYELDGYFDYYYGYMAASTGILKYFDLTPLDEGFVLLYPSREEPRTIGEYDPPMKLFSVLKEADSWSRMMGITCVGDLNEAVSAGRGNELILLQEALQEKRIGDIACRIADDPEKKFVLIAGPSSSGKTSFANRLSIQLRTLGLTPHIISSDNYFVNRDDTPLDKDGNKDYECLGAMDVKQLNEDLNRLLKGEEVAMPTYNFILGQREYRGDTMKLGEKDILVMEGIHCLNDELTYDLPAQNKFKIYVSALTVLNIDEHNRIPTTDNRLLRRMVRDARTRGNSAAATIKSWPSVRRGEENNIFPYQEQADVMFNSALVYELAVEKQYCERLLYDIPEDSPEYVEAKRLLKFLGYFLGLESENLPRNSIGREFVGGSCFNV